MLKSIHEECQVEALWHWKMRKIPTDYTVYYCATRDDYRNPRMSNTTHGRPPASLCNING